MVSDLKHTPGPWFIKQVESKFMIVHESECAVICTTNDWDEKFKDEEQANARLIAAAPELLAALIEARSLLEESEQCYENQMFRNVQIDAAIRKAKG